MVKWQTDIRRLRPSMGNDRPKNQETKREVRRQFEIGFNEHAGLGELQHDKQQ